MTISSGFSGKTKHRQWKSKKKQIASLQKINRQLSQYVHKNQSELYERLYEDQMDNSQDANLEGRTDNKQDANLGELLKNIHIHSKSP